jgi:hypothetical protein
VQEEKQDQLKNQIFHLISIIKDYIIFKINALLNLLLSAKPYIEFLSTKINDLQETVQELIKMMKSLSEFVKALKEVKDIIVKRD